MSGFDHVPVFIGHFSVLALVLQDLILLSVIVHLVIVDAVTMIVVIFIAYFSFLGLRNVLWIRKIALASWPA